MTEPTHHLRPDVSAQLDIVLVRIMLHVGIDDLEVARDVLRDALAEAWHHGWMSGHDDASEMRRPLTESPYMRRPATPAAETQPADQGESPTIS